MFPTSLALAVSLAATVLRLPAPPAVVFEHDVMVPMRDGVKLAFDIWRPASGRVPALVTRTPYGTDSPGMEHANDAMVQMGYAIVTVDCRGKFGSEGEWYPIRNEGKDGFDSIEWVARQPWCDGNVGMMGGSYDGWTQMLAAAESPPHLKALLPQATPPDPIRNFPWQNGAFLAASAYWARMTFGKGVDRLEDLTGKWSSIYAHRPLIEMDQAAGAEIPYFDDWVRHPLDDDYWRSMSYQTRFADIDVPALHVTGWFDDDQVGALSNFVGLRRAARSERARRGQRLIVGPWGHVTNGVTKLGELDFGEDARIDLSTLTLRWFDHWLGGADNGIEREAPVRVFVIGPNVWRDEDDWPIPRTRWTPYFLAGGGRLAAEAPADAPADEFTYDPHDPTPFLTGERSAQVGGPDDYSTIHRTRKDLVVYDTAPLDEDTEVTGPIAVVLHAATSARDTDWTAMLCDVRPDGKVVRLSDGVIRAMLSESLETPKPVVPDVPREYRIDCWATGYVFTKGHCIRVAIASAAFPKFHPNANTGNRDPAATECVVAHQKIFHDAAHPSRLILPVIPPRAPAGK